MKDKILELEKTDKVFDQPRLRVYREKFLVNDEIRKDLHISNGFAKTVAYDLIESYKKTIKAIKIEHDSLSKKSVDIIDNITPDSIAKIDAINNATVKLKELSRMCRMEIKSLTNVANDLLSSSTQNSSATENFIEILDYIIYLKRLLKKIWENKESRDFILKDDIIDSKEKYNNFLKAINVFNLSDDIETISTEFKSVVASTLKYIQVHKEDVEKVSPELINLLSEYIDKTDDEMKAFNASIIGKIGDIIKDYYDDTEEKNNEIAMINGTDENNNFLVCVNTLKSSVHVIKGMLKEVGNGDYSEDGLKVIKEFTDEINKRHSVATNAAYNTVMKKLDYLMPYVTEDEKLQAFTLVVYVLFTLTKKESVIGLVKIINRMSM